jgi:SAM-dependent methyltransferase
MALVDYDTYTEFRDPQTYDLICDAFSDDFALLDQWTNKLGNPLLDLACGTGRMALRLAAQGYEVTGVDLIPEMISWARKKAAARGVSVEWIVADAREFRLGRQFPFIFMLMNAFQFLPGREDHEAMLARVREHLMPNGCFLFETRNPTPQNLQGLFNPGSSSYPLADGGTLTTSDEQYYDPMTQIQHWTGKMLFTRADGTREERINRAALRYVYPQEMEALLHYNGFRIREVYGNWQGEPLTANSPAMIYVCENR